KGRPDLAGGHRRRKVPGRDQYRDADWLMVDQDTVRTRRRMTKLSRNTNRLFRIPAKELGGIGNLASRVGQRLAVLGGSQCRQFLAVVVRQLVPAWQELRPLLRGCGPRAGGGRQGSVHCLRGALDGGIGHFSQRQSSSWIFYRDAYARPPFSADIHAVSV